MAATARLDRTGEPIEEDDRTDAERAAYGAGLARSVLATRKERFPSQVSRVSQVADLARAPVVGPVVNRSRVPE